MEKIKAPGIYDMPEEFYHGDCCVEPSLSASGAVTLIQECEAIYWHGSYMNPEREPVENKAFDLGTSSHLMILEPHLFEKKVVVIEADSYRTNLAKAQRDAAYEAGKTPILIDQLEGLKAMRKELFSHPIAKHAFSKGKPEQTLIWQDEATGVWCKSRPDWMPEGVDYLIDYKTSTTANPDTFIRSAADHGYYQKAAWQMEAVKQVTGKAPSRFYFVLQSVRKPHLVSVFELDHVARGWGDILNAKARERFARCLKTGEWPGFKPDERSGYAAFPLLLPHWVEKDLEKRHERGAFALSMEFHQPIKRAAE